MTYTLQGGVSVGDDDTGGDSEGAGIQPLDAAQQLAAQLAAGTASYSPVLQGSASQGAPLTSQTQGGTPGTQTQNIQVALPQQTAAPANITYPATNTLQFNAQDPGIPAALAAPAGASIGTGLPAPTALASPPALPYSAPPNFGNEATGTGTASANPNETAQGWMPEGQDSGIFTPASPQPPAQGTQQQAAAAQAMQQAGYQMPQAAPGPGVPGTAPPAIPGITPPTPMQPNGRPQLSTGPQGLGGFQDPNEFRKLDPVRQLLIAQALQRAQQARAEGNLDMGPPDKNMVASLYRLAQMREQQVKPHPFQTLMRAGARSAMNGQPIQTNVNPELLRAQAAEKYFSQHKSPFQHNYEAKLAEYNKANEDVNGYLKDFQNEVEKRENENATREHMPLGQIVDAMRELKGIPNGPMRDGIVDDLVKGGAIHNNPAVANALKSAPWDETQARKGDLENIAKMWQISNAQELNTTRKTQNKNADTWADLKTKSMQLKNAASKANNEWLEAKGKNANAIIQSRLAAQASAATNAANNHELKVQAFAMHQMDFEAGLEQKALTAQMNPFLKGTPEQEALQEKIKQDAGKAKQDYKEKLKNPGMMQLAKPQPPASDPVTTAHRAAYKQVLSDIQKGVTNKDEANKWLTDNGYPAFETLAAKFR